MLLTELSRSVWENLDLGRVYRPHCVRSVLTTSVKILPYRPPVLSNKSPRMLTCERVINYQIFFKRFPFLQNKSVNLHRLIMTLNNFESQPKSLLDLK